MEIIANRMPRPWSDVICSLKNILAMIIVIMGYNDVNGTIIEAFPLFNAMLKAIVPIAPRTPASIE